MALPGTEDACCPFFSPDGKWLAYHARDQVSKVRLGVGGPPVPVVGVNTFFAADWADDGTIVVSDLQGRRVIRVNAETGAREALPYMVRLLDVLPGGRGTITDTSLIVPGEAEPRQLLATGSDTRYAPPGHLLFAQRGALWAVPFSLATLQTGGEPVPILPVLRTEAGSRAAQYAVACALGHTVPQLPQCNGSLARLEHVPEQSTCGDWQVTPHAPPEHVVPPEHEAPHAPQLALSLRVSTSQPSAARPLQSA